MFHEKPFLKLSKPIIKNSGQTASTTISIERYVIFDLPIEDMEQKKEVEKLIKESYVNLIDYWAVDWNYDGETFQSAWQAFRGFGGYERQTKDIPTQVTKDLPTGKRYTVAVRAVDIFGNDAEASCIVDLR